MIDFYRSEQFMQSFLVINRIRVKRFYLLQFYILSIHRKNKNMKEMGAPFIDWLLRRREENTTLWKGKTTLKVSWAHSSLLGEVDIKYLPTLGILAEFHSVPHWGEKLNNYLTFDFFSLQVQKIVCLVNEFFGMNLATIAVALTLD